MVLVPEICQFRSSEWREKLGAHETRPAKVWPISKSERPRSPFRLRGSCALAKLYWMVPPVFELSSIDLA